MPRWVKQEKSPHPICRRCKHPHVPSGRCVGSPDDWTPVATEEEADERAWELFFVEFGHSRGPQEVELMKRELLKIHRKSPGISGAEGVKQLGDLMRARGFRSQGS